MKDELDGKFITEAYFLVIKQYGYKYLDVNNNIIERCAVYLLLMWLIQLKVKKIDSFFKSLKNLSINIKPTKITIQANSHKILINNTYLPINIINLNNPLDRINKIYQ